MGTFIKNRKDSSSGKVKAELSENRGRTRPCFDITNKKPYSFLNEVFKPIPSVDLPVCEIPFGQVSEEGVVYWTYLKEIKIDAVKNIEYLISSVRAFCKIQCADFDFTPTNNPLSDLSTLFCIVKDVASTDHEVALDYDEKTNMVVIREYDLCDFEYNTLFFFPVSFVDKLPKELQPIVKDSYSLLTVGNFVQKPEDHGDASFALGLWDNGEQLEILKDEDPKLYEERKSLIDSYLEGDIHNLISECSNPFVDRKAAIDKLEEARKNYAGTQYGSLLNSLRDGLVLNEEGSWADYMITPSHCAIEDYDDHDEGMFDPSRLFVVVYDLMDEIVEETTYNINGDAGNLEVSGLYDYRTLTPEISTSFVASDFLKRWSDWFYGFMDAIENIKYEQQTNKVS